ncbi:MAG: aminopeptidase [Pyrinomonadaceae bacterium]|nr:aminopeptidase [Pyrinomonadaceae bacterium]
MNSFSLQILIFGVFILLCSCTSDIPAADKGYTDGQKRQTLDFDKISKLLLERMNLQKGEKVLLVARPGRFDPLIPLLKSGIEKAGAFYLGTLSVSASQPAVWNTDFVLGAKGLDDEKLQKYLKAIDLGVMLPGPTPGDKIYQLIQDNLNDNVGRTIHFHWSGAYRLDGSPMTVDAKVDNFYQMALLSTDYDALAASQAKLESAMRGKTIRVTSPAGTDISFSIGDRPVTKQNGDASKANTDKGRNLIDREIELPAGAIRVAPIEESVNGVVVFPDGRWDGNAVKGLTLKFRKGKVVSIEAKEGAQHAKNEIARAGEAGKSFREFALGVNPALAIPVADPWIPYYGYGAGIVRLSLGNNLELGGKVGGNYVRWNFFVDTSVEIGSEMWVKNGKLIRW